MQTTTVISDQFGASQAMNNQTGKTNNQLGQQDFLALMVAQLENQDPTKPMDNNQFMAQMAQFSMVNGIDELNGSFATVADSIMGAQGLQAAALLDRQVITGSNIGRYDGVEPLEGMVPNANYASNVEIQVRDKSGELVRSFMLDSSVPGNRDFSWDGLNQSGQPVAAGDYQINAVGTVSGQVQSLQVGVANQIESISLNQHTQQITLNLSNGQTAYLSDVAEYR